MVVLAKKLWPPSKDKTPFHPAEEPAATTKPQELQGGSGRGRWHSWLWEGKLWAGPYKSWQSFCRAVFKGEEDTPGLFSEADTCSSWKGTTSPTDKHPHIRGTRPRLKAFSHFCSQVRQVGSCFCKLQPNLTKHLWQFHQHLRWSVAARLAEQITPRKEEPVHTRFWAYATPSHKGRWRSHRHRWGDQGPAHCHQTEKIRHHVCNSLRKKYTVFWVL